MQHKKKTTLLIGGSVAGVLLFTGSAIAISELAVDAPLFPAVGQANASPCDADGVTTAFSYGNTSANGVKVTAANVTGIAAACKTATVEFVKSDAVVPNATYSGPVTNGAASLTTSIFTNQFDTVRVYLQP